MLQENMTLNNVFIMRCLRDVSRKSKGSLELSSAGDEHKEGTEIYLFSLQEITQHKLFCS